MTDETHSSYPSADDPVIRDPQAPANLLAQPATTWTPYVPSTSSTSDASDAAGRVAYNGTTPSSTGAQSSALGGSNADTLSPDLLRADTLSSLEAVSDDTESGLGLRLHNDEADEIERGLARLDPLTVRPRTSSRVLCVVFAVLMVAAAFGVWWIGVHTEDGQAYEDMVFVGFKDSLPMWASPMVAPFLQQSMYLGLPIPINLTVVCSVVIILVAAVVMVVRRRWWLIGQSVVFAVLCFAATFLKEALPRPFIINTQSQNINSAPSGHTILAASAGILLLVAVPRVWRAISALIAAAYAIVIGLSVIAGAWHRPSDVVMGLLLVGAIALLILACTRTSGMDAPGARASSASIQIVGTVMITAGIIFSLYAAYIIWQIQPGLSLSASWVDGGAHISTFCMISGVSLLVFGIVLVMRQLTASPLTKLGLVGAPPAPPRR